MRTNHPRAIRNFLSLVQFIEYWVDTIVNATRNAVDGRLIIVISKAFTFTNK